MTLARTSAQSVACAHAPRGRRPYSLASGLAMCCRKPLLRLYNYLSPKITGSPATAMLTSLLVIRHAAEDCPGSTPQAALDDPSIGRVMARDWLIPEIRSSDLVASCVVRVALHCCFPVSRCAASLTRMSTGRRRRPNGMKVYLASWRHSADTATNACRSKVIAGRFYDAAARGAACPARKCLKCLWSRRNCRAISGTIVQAGVTLAPPMVLPRRHLAFNLRQGTFASHFFSSPIVAGKWSASAANRPPGQR